MLFKLIKNHINYPLDLVNQYSNLIVQVIIHFWPVPCLRLLAAGLSPRRPVFAPGSIHVGFMADKVALG
jgi:hypothetical protein